MDLVTAVADTFIPRTDTPGAVDAGVPAQFAAMLAKWAAPATRTAFLARLDAIDVAARGGKGKPFAKLSAKDRLAVLKAYDAANFAAPDYKRLRDLFLILYYNSEPGATVELRYEHAPGAFVPSIPMTAETRAWAGMSFF
ncbi:MAG: gluconate 2-dehydrogenase subunit 3 family protein [Novosphingobium sp.]